MSTPSALNPGFQRMLNDLIEDRAYSIRGLARDVGLTPAAIRHLLRGTLYELPKVATLRALADALDVMPEDLAAAALGPSLTPATDANGAE